MPATKISYKSRIPTVLKIIEEAKEPIGYTELHERLIKETGVKLSKHTLNKCLEQLYAEGRIKKRGKKGVGNPIKYSINIVSSNIHFEHITEEDNWKILGDEISGILVELILLFYIYCQRTDKKEFEGYRIKIDVTLIRRMLEIERLIKHPVIISKNPTDTLSKVFYQTFKNFRNKVVHSPEKIPKEEYEKICHLIKEELGELYLDTGDPDYLYHMISKDFSLIDSQEETKHQERLGETFLKLNKNKTVENIRDFI